MACADTENIPLRLQQTKHPQLWTILRMPVLIVALALLCSSTRHFSPHLRARLENGIGDILCNSTSVRILHPIIDDKHISSDSKFWRGVGCTDSITNLIRKW